MNRACFCFLSSVLMVATALAQTPERLLSFEVASVKKNTSGESRTSMRTQPGGRFVVTNARLKGLIATAFEMADSPSLIDSRILGAPDWIGSERYDIVAKSSTEFRPSPAGPARELLLMMRSLLEERYKLVAHSETRELPIYELVVEIRTMAEANPFAGSARASAMAPTSLDPLFAAGRSRPPAHEPADRAFQRDGASDRGLDRAATGRGVS